MLEISSDTVSHAMEPIEVTPYWNQTFTHRAFSNAAAPTVNHLLDLYRSRNQTITWILEVSVVLLNPPIEKIDVLLSSSLEMSINHSLRATWN